MTPTEEEFQTWRENPITGWVMAAYQRAADDAKALWVKQSWDAGICNPDVLIETRSLAAAYEDIVNLTHADALAALSEDE